MGHSSQGVPFVYHRCWTKYSAIDFSLEGVGRNSVAEDDDTDDDDENDDDDASDDDNASTDPQLEGPGGSL